MKRLIYGRSLHTEPSHIIIVDMELLVVRGIGDGNRKLLMEIEGRSVVLFIGSEREYTNYC